MKNTNLGLSSPDLWSHSLLLHLLIPIRLFGDGVTVCDPLGPARSLCAAGGRQTIRDGSMIIAWLDGRNTQTTTSGGSINAVKFLDVAKHLRRKKLILPVRHYGRPHWRAYRSRPATPIFPIILQSVARFGWGRGLLLAWRDGRNGTDAIYAQKIGADGKIKWASGGLDVSEDGYLPFIVSDGLAAPCSLLAIRPIITNANYVRISASGTLGSTNSVGDGTGMVLGLILDSAGNPIVARNTSSDNSLYVTNLNPASGWDCQGRRCLY